MISFVQQLTYLGSCATFSTLTINIKWPCVKCCLVQEKISLSTLSMRLRICWLHPPLHRCNDLAKSTAFNSFKGILYFFYMGKAFGVVIAKKQKMKIKTMLITKMTLTTNVKLAHFFKGDSIFKAFISLCLHMHIWINTVLYLIYECR